MKRPDQQLIDECDSLVQQYIDHLERQCILSQHHRDAEMMWEQTMMRLVGEDGLADVEKAINKIKAQAQRATLDQFAMAALPELVRQRHLMCFEAAAAAYNYAEAMLAESRKRQGGAE